MRKIRENGFFSFLCHIVRKRRKCVLIFSGHIVRESDGWV